MAQTFSSPRAQAAKMPLTGWRVLAATLGLALTVSGTTGCMVLDELDASAAKMPSAPAAQKKTADANKGQGTAAERLAATKSMLAERSKVWWSQAKTMTPGESVAGVVTCHLPEGKKFMNRDDCLAQGGRAADGGS